MKTENEIKNKMQGGVTTPHRPDLHHTPCGRPPPHRILRAKTAGPLAPPHNAFYFLYILDSKIARIPVSTLILASPCHWLLTPMGKVLATVTWSSSYLVPWMLTPVH